MYVTRLFALCFVFVWAVVSATGLSVLWNTFSTFILRVVLFVICVLWNKMNEWMNVQWVHAQWRLVEVVVGDRRCEIDDVWWQRLQSTPSSSSTVYDVSQLSSVVEMCQLLKHQLPSTKYYVQLYYCVNQFLLQLHFPFLDFTTYIYRRLDNMSSSSQRSAVMSGRHGEASWFNNNCRNIKLAHLSLLVWQRLPQHEAQMTRRHLRWRVCHSTGLCVCQFCFISSRIFKSRVTMTGSVLCTPCVIAQVLPHVNCTGNDGCLCA